MTNLAINPALAALQFNEKVDAHLDGKVRNLLEKMNRMSSQYDDVSILFNELNLRTNFDQDGVSFIDFTNTDFQEIIDRLHESGILDGEIIYKFETKKEIDIFKAKLEGIGNQLKNKNQEPILLIQPLLNLMEQMNKIAKACSDSDEKLKEKINSR